MIEPYEKKTTYLLKKTYIPSHEIFGTLIKARKRVHKLIKMKFCFAPLLQLGQLDEQPRLLKGGLSLVSNANPNGYTAQF